MPDPLDSLVFQLARLRNERHQPSEVQTVAETLERLKSLDKKKLNETKTSSVLDKSSKSESDLVSTLPAQSVVSVANEQSIPSKVVYVHGGYA
jgi:hypothetical protein